MSTAKGAGHTLRDLTPQEVAEERVCHPKVARARQQTRQSVEQSFDEDDASVLPAKREKHTHDTESIYMILVHMPGKVTEQAIVRAVLQGQPAPRGQHLSSAVIGRISMLIITNGLNKNAVWDNLFQPEAGQQEVRTRARALRAPTPSKGDGVEDKAATNTGVTERGD